MDGRQSGRGLVVGRSWVDGGRQSQVGQAFFPFSVYSLSIVDDAVMCYCKVKQDLTFCLPTSSAETVKLLSAEADDVVGIPVVVVPAVAEHCDLAPQTATKQAHRQTNRRN